ncbi:MAG: radical SAM protein [Candidatus Aminicenantes bacterium]|nr:radical SAM protein [Candidatus Aminicenantes bacterium]
MNKRYTLEIPAGLEPVKGPFDYVLRGEDAASLAKRFRLLSNSFTVKGINCSGSLNNKAWLDLLEVLPEEIFVMVECAGRAEFNEIIEKLSKRRSEILLRSSNKELEKNVRYWAHNSFQIKIVLDRFDEKTPGIFSDILDFYIHTPFIAKHIFPLHFLMDGFLNVRDVGLLDYSLGYKGGWFRVDEKGNVRFVFPSEKLPNLGMLGSNFGPIEKKAADFSRNYFEKLAAQDAVCLTCPYFRLCGGFFLLFENKGTCSWPPFFESLEQEIELAREHFSKVREEKERSGTQKDCTLFVSQECVNNCVFCAVADKRKNKLPDFYERVRESLMNITREKVRHLSFSGAGETTLNPDLPELAEEAKKRGVEEIIVFTNGYGMTEKKMKILVSKGVDGFLLSLHGLGMNHDKAVRRKGAFKDVLYFLDVWKRVVSRIKISVNTCLTKFSLDDINKLADFTRAHQVMLHSIVFPEWSGNVLSAPEYIPTYFQVREALKNFRAELYPHVLFDNIPRCMVPDNRELHFITHDGMIFYDDISKSKEFPRDSSKLFNRKLQACENIKCRHRDECCGFDKKYLEYHGEAALAAFIIKWGRPPKRHV